MSSAPELVDQESVRERKGGETYGTADNKNPLLFPPNPLTDLIRRLGQSHFADMGCSDAVEFKERRDPSQRDGVSSRAVVDFEMGVFSMDARVEHVVEG